MICFYDFETFSQDWLVVIVDALSEKEHVIVNDRDELKRFYESHKNYIWCGFNSRSFDTWILRAILAGYNPQDMTKFIIEEGRKGWEFDKTLLNIPLYNYDVRWSNVVSGLKTLEAFMGSAVEESSVPFDLDRKLTQSEIEETIEYCRHDVYQTIKVFTNSLQEFDAHWSLIKEFDLDLSCISKTKAQLTAIILDCVKQDRNDEWNFDFEEPCYGLKKYTELLDWFRNPENRTLFTKKQIEIDICGVPTTYGWGGCHGAIPNYFEEGYFINCDVASYYPALMIEWDMLSRNCRSPEKFKIIFEKRLKLKAEGKKKEQAPYKIVLNGTYGAAGDKYNPLYDPRQTHRVCMAGQIFLTILAERLEGIAQPININTDGILFKIEDQSKLDDYYRICKEWEQETKMVLEHDRYTKVWQRDVNNYIVEDDKGKIKSKGAVVKKLSTLDYDLKVVNEAVVNYFVNGTPPEKTIQDNKRMLDFQKVFKVSMKYKHALLGCTITKVKGKSVWLGDGEILKDKCHRVFANTEPTGILYKKKDGKNPEKFANCPNNCFIENGDITNANTDDYPNLNKQWYIDHAWYRIRQFKGEIK